MATEELEIWRDLPDYEGIYQVSNLGNVKSLDRIDASGHSRKGFIMKQKINNKGYFSIALCKNGKYKFYQVHRLVAQTFLPNPNNLPQVNHKNEDKTDNRVENLEWCTIEYNCNYGTRNERAGLSNSIAQSGKDKPYKYKKIIQLDVDGNIIKQFCSIKQAVEELNIKQPNISSCLIGKCKTTGGYKWQYAS